MVVTGINPTTGPTRNFNLHIGGGLGLGTGVLDHDRYFITDQESNLPTLDAIQVKYSGRIDDVTYYN